MIATNLRAQDCVPAGEMALFSGTVQVQIISFFTKFAEERKRVIIFYIRSFLSFKSLESNDCYVFCAMIENRTTTMIADRCV